MFNLARIRRIILPLVCFLLCFSSLTMAETAKPAPWWKTDMISAIGHGFPPDHAENLGQAKIFAKQAAMLDAYRHLAEQAAGIHITATQTMTEAKIKAIITGAKITKEEYDEHGNCSIVLSVPIYGVESSFAQAAIKPATKKNFPEPNKKLSAAIPVEGNYTGLIIDCDEALAEEDDDENETEDLNPVLLPTVLSSDNKVIYSLDNLDREKVVAGGMITYSEKSDLERQIERVGHNPLIVKATKLTNDNSTPILSAVDTAKILSENRASHFLDNCAVVMLSTKGPRDSIGMGTRSKRKFSDGRV